MNILLNFDLKSSKKLIFLLPEIYGVGFSLSKQICKYLGYNYNTSVQDLSVNDLKKINSIITIKCKLIVETDLKKQKHDAIKSMKNIKSYRGVRHFYGLPVNGQRTRTNAKTRG